jgi:hypothetical protein
MPPCEALMSPAVEVCKLIVMELAASPHAGNPLAPTLKFCDRFLLPKHQLTPTQAFK